MELTNEFDVPAPIHEAWRILTDLELIAPCMPGAQLTEVDGDDFKGSVKVKVGPITAQFKGTASFVERDATAHRGVIKAQGRDTGGKGNANATITAELSPDGDGTHVTITTDLSITGKVAQFGRGALAEISTKLLGQFVDCLEEKVLAGNAGGAKDASEGTGAEPVDEDPTPSDAGQRGPSDDAKPAPPAASPARPRTIHSAEPEPVDLLGTAGAPTLRQLAPVVAGVLGLVIVGALLRRRRR